MLITFSSSSSSSSSSTSSSARSPGDRCDPAEQGMSTFEHRHRRHSPSLSHSKAKKRHRPRHYPSHSPPPLHRHRHYSLQHYLPPSSAPPCRSDNHPHDKGKPHLRLHEPSNKARELHHKLMKASKRQRGARHAHRPFPSEHDFLSNRFGDQRPPGCCMHSVEEGRLSCKEPCDLHEIGFRYHGSLHCQAHPHPPGGYGLCQGKACVESELLGGADAIVSPSGAEVPLIEPAIEHGRQPPASCILTVDEAALAP